MCKKLCVFVLIFAVASVANAAAIRYAQNGDWTLVDATATGQPGWQGTMPGAVDEARINWGGNTVTVTSAVPTVWRVYPGCDESGTLDVQAGGVVTTTDCGMVAVGGNPNTGTINIAAGGLVDLTGGGAHLWVAEAGASLGYINVSGTLNVGGILGLGSVGFATTGGAGYLTVNDGGVVNLSNIHGDIVNFPSVMNASKLDIIGTGLVTLPGDFEAVVDAYAAAQKITGNGYGGNIVTTVTYDPYGAPLQTLVTAIPEPATMILLGIGGLLIRRRKA